MKTKLTLLALALCTASTYAAEKEWSMFTAMDKNKDAQVTQAEWTQWQQKQAKKKSRDFSMKTSVTAFTKLDANQDGHLTQSEMDAMRNGGKKNKKAKKDKKNES